MMTEPGKLTPFQTMTRHKIRPLGGLPCSNTTPNFSSQIPQNSRNIYSGVYTVPRVYLQFGDQKYNKESIFWYLFSLLKYVCRSYKSFFLRTEPFQIFMLDPNFLCSNRLNQVVPDIIIKSGNDFFKFPGYPLIRPCPQQTILCKMRVGITLVNKMCNLHQFKL